MDSNIIPTSNTNLTFEEIFQWLKKEESVSYNAYPDGRDSRGNQLFSIGYGHQIKPNEKDLLTRTISSKEAIQLFEKDIQLVRSDMKRLIKVPLNKNEELAIISFRYNIGPEAFANSTFLKKLNAKDFNAASLEFARWKFTDNGTKVSQALLQRREREKKLFLSTSVNNNNLDQLKKQLQEAEETVKREKEKLEKMLKPTPPKTYNT
jgi:lysozyme